ncbi:hypothetical protein AB3N59_19835 [Leptospira sp. WS92.C1]
MNSKFDNSKSKIKDHLSLYDRQEILYYLFSLFLWIPNISAVVKSELTYAIFLSLPKEVEKDDRKPNFSYDRFLYFCRKLIRLFPDFKTIEDFIPKTDWGEIKYFLNNKHYKILYGGNYLNPHDYITQFELLHFPFVNYYEQKIGILPQEALQEILQLTDDIINGIDQKSLDSTKMLPGHLEIPPKTFWDSCKVFLDGFQDLVCESKYLITAVISIGGIAESLLSEDVFLNKISAESITRKFLIEHDGKLFPFLPRNYIHNLFNSWGENFSSVSEIGIREIEHVVTMSFANFVDGALENVQILPFVEIEGIDGVFHFGIAQSNKLILVRIGDIFSPIEVEEEWKSINLESANFSNIKVMGCESKFGLQNKAGEFEEEENSDLDLEIIYLSVELVSLLKKITLPKSLNFHPWFSIDFIGILTSVDSLEQLFKFFEFKRKEESRIFGASLSQMDYFGAFSDSSGILVKGASKPNIVYLDPHWGVNFRYCFLKNFYEPFPNIPVLGKPYGWKVASPISSEIVTLIKKNKKTICLSTKNEFINAVLILDGDDLDIESFKILHLLGECLIYNINRYSNEIIKSNFPHLKAGVVIHLVSAAIQGGWRFVKHRNAGVEEVILEGNVNQISDLFLNLEDRSKENELLLSFLSSVVGERLLFNSIVYRKLQDDVGNAPGFKLFESKLEFDRPGNLVPVEISNYEIFYTQKVIAELCEKLGIVPNIYKGEAAKTILNTIRNSLISDLERRIQNYNYEGSIVSLIIEGEALYIKFKDLEARIVASKNQSVDYDRVEAFSRERNDFLDLHRSFRYLLSKFVSLVPIGTSVLTKEETLDLLVVSKEILHLYRISDNLHYTVLEQYEIEIGEDYILQFHLPNEILKKLSKFQDKYATERINPSNKYFKSSGVISDSQTFNNEINKAFFSDFGFSADDFLACLGILRFLPSSMNIKYDGCVRLSKNELIGHVSNTLEINSLVTLRIIEFLTLKTSEVLTILGDKKGEIKSVNDIPVWEYAKRYSRPEIRPLIEESGLLYFGTGNVYASLLIWQGCISRFYFPYTVSSSNVEKFLDKAEKLFQAHLVDVAYCIVREFTKHLTKEIDIPDLIPGANDIGDVDVLAVLDEKKIILNIECKYIRDTFSVKDTRRVRDKIFRSSSSGKNYLEKVELRHNELGLNKNEVLTHYRINLDKLSGYKIVSLFVTNNYNFWTLNPERKTDVDFVYIEDLKSYLQNMISN